ncbi:MAG: MIP/aquaporin family protein [Bacillota bacterium]
MSPFIGEVVGTMILIIFGSGVVANVNLKNSKAQGAGWIVVALGWGLGVSIAIYAVGQVSGAHINPAVTIALAVIGEFSWSNVPGYIMGQFIGAFLGAVIVYFHFFPHWKETNEKHIKLGVFCTDPAIPHTLSNLVSEMIGTAILLIGLLSIGSNEFADGLNPYIIGFLVVAIGLSLGGTTGYAINPARDLGPRIAHFILPISGKGKSNWEYSWIPVVGPIIGGAYGALVYQAIFYKTITLTFWFWTAVLIFTLLLAHLLGKKGTQSTEGGKRVKN